MTVPVLAAPALAAIANTIVAPSKSGCETEEAIVMNGACGATPHPQSKIDPWTSVITTVAVDADAGALTVVGLTENLHGPCGMVPS